MIDYKGAMVDYRTQNGLSQQDMADKLEISQQVYSNIESGKKKKIDADFVVKYKEVTGINLWDLPENVVNDGPRPSVMEQRRKAKQTHNLFEVPFVPVKAQAGYVKAVDQETYLNTLEQYALPPGVNPQGAVWRYWEIEGDSMEPSYHSGDYILTSQVHQFDWENLRNFYAYVIVTEDRVLFKRLYCKNALEWVLISDNEKEFPQQLLPVESIKEVWVMRRHIVNKVPVPQKFEIKV